MTQSQTEALRKFQESLAGGEIDALLFDLDGVLTPTSDLHRRAWRMLFEPVLDEYGVDPYREEDYFDYIDGRPRIDGVRTLLQARGIDLPEGGPDDPEDVRTVYSMAEYKNVLFNEILSDQGVSPYPGSQAYLDFLATYPGVKLAVVSSSKNAEQILQMSNLAHYFATVVDGKVAAREGIAGKPAPDTYLRAAEVLGTVPERSVVIEDAISGVESGARGDFAHTIGVNRGAGADELSEAGATLVVDDLVELIAAGEG